MSYIAPTPPRPLPGQYIQTPAASRFQQTGNRPLPPLQANRNQVAPLSTQSTSLALAQSPAQAAKSTEETLTPLQRAASTINKTLDSESRYPELDNYIGQGISSEYDTTPPSSWAPFQKVKMYPIPDKIFLQYNRAQVSTMMGLLADLHHAWITIDNALYLWDYTHPDPELVGFEEQTNSITAVTLAYPRPGVFVPAITRLLVVATTAEVLLVGLSSELKPDGGRSLALYHLRMSVPTKGLDVTVIQGSATTGRIFFTGTSDNDLYELTYQSEEKWFQNRCGIISHTSKGWMASLTPSFAFATTTDSEHTIQIIIDDTRDLLYTLSSRSSIRVFHMGKDSKLDLVLTKPMSHTLSDIGHKILQTDLVTASTKLVAIAAITAHEASRLNLMATTSTGCRVFMSATSSYGSHMGNAYGKIPSSMQVHHVKFPPPSTLSSPAAYGHAQPLDTASRSLTTTRTMARYAPGFFFCFVNPDRQAQSDTLFMSAPDPGRIARPPEPSVVTRFAELGTWTDLGSRAEDVGLVSSPFSAAPTPAGFANELAVQFDRATSEIAILTNTGIHTFRRRRLVDMFASTVRLKPGDAGLEGEVKKFIRLYGRSETAATALAVACGQGLDVTADERVAGVTDPDILGHARTSFIDYGGKPSSDGNMAVDQTSAMIDAVRPSPRHDGLALYLSRLIRSVWYQPIIVEISTPSGGLQVLSSVSLTKLRDVQRDLTKLQEFLTSNQTFIDGLAGPDSLTRTSTRQAEIELQAEHRALHALVQLIRSVLEGLSFVQVLFDERTEDIMLSLAPDTRKQVRDLTFQTLFCSATGKDLAKELIKAIVDRNIANGSNVDTIADALQRRCGSFCSAGDVVIFKAQEQLKRATEAGSKSELGRNWLNESLRLFKQVAADLSMEQLQWATQQYELAEFYGGAIELALDVAKESDRGNRALSWIQDGRPAQDPRAQAFARRKRCYNLIHSIMQALDQVSTAMPTMTDEQHALAQRRKFEAYQVIDTSDDEAFQTDLYDWYLEQHQAHRILQVQSRYVETYLQRKSQEHVEHADLLWRYYAQANRPQDAARVQLELAKSDFPLPLSERIAYLSRAKANSETNVPSIGRRSNQSLKREIADLLDVANIQDDLVERLKGDGRWENTPEKKEQVIRGLDGPIQDLTVLYNTYTEGAEYFDLSILIFHSADHRNPVDIRNTWRSLLERTHTEALHRRGVKPYEVVANVVRTLGMRLGLADFSFPIPDLVLLLERYAFEFQRGIGPATWVVDVFLDLQVPQEALFAALEAMLYADEPPFQGRNRAIVAADALYVAQRWMHDTARSQAHVFGSASGADAVAAAVQLVLQQGLAAPEALEEWRALGMRVDQAMR